MPVTKKLKHKIQEIGRIQYLKVWFCNAEIGDKFHYVLKCKMDIKSVFLKQPNIIQFNTLMNSSNKNIINNLCVFIDIIITS